MNEVYVIRLKGHLDMSWSEQLGAVTITHRENGETWLIGLVPDQAALHGLLNRLRDIGVTLIALNAMSETPPAPEAPPPPGSF